MVHRMGADSFSGRYTPTSPLSPRPPSSHGPLAAQPPRPRAQHGRQASRNLHMNLPRFHPANFAHLDSPATPSSTVQSPAITLNRVTAPVAPESPRLMREKQREFLERANLSSKIAASSMGVKPGSPRLDPLGSPGPVTPLALDEAGDYFQVKGAGKVSPGPSPRSPRSDCSSDREGVKKQKKARHTDVYQ